jgi:hypothetical protein
MTLEQYVIANIPSVILITVFVIRQEGKHNLLAQRVKFLERDLEKSGNGDRGELKEIDHRLDSLTRLQDQLIDFINSYMAESGKKIFSRRKSD